MVNRQSEYNKVDEKIDYTQGIIKAQRCMSFTEEGSSQGAWKRLFAYGDPPAQASCIDAAVEAS